MSKLDFDSAIRRFDPSRPSQISSENIGFSGSRRTGQTGTDGTRLPHDNRHKDEFWETPETPASPTPETGSSPTAEIETPAGTAIAAGDSIGCFRRGAKRVRNTKDDSLTIEVSPRSDLSRVWTIDANLFVVAFAAADRVLA